MTKFLVSTTKEFTEETTELIEGYDMRNEEDVAEEYFRKHLRKDSSANINVGDEIIVYVRRFEIGSKINKIKSEVIELEPTFSTYEVK